MTEQKGHFEKGRWIKEMEPSVVQPAGAALDQRLSEAVQGFRISLGEIVTITRELVTTEEGKQYVEQNVKHAQDRIRSSLDEIVIRAQNELDKRIPVGRKQTA